MEIQEQKKNKKLYIIIAILTILLIGSVGYIVYNEFIKKDETIENNELNNNQEENNETNNEEEQKNNNEENKLSEEEEIAIIKKELGKIFSCTNGEEMCVEYMQYSTMLPEIDDEDLNYDFFKLAAPYIMEAIYNLNYINVDWLYGIVYLMTDNQEQKYSDYFDFDLMFDTYDGLYGFKNYEDMLEYCNNDINCTFINNYNNYKDKGYKIAYIVGDGFGSHGTDFKIETITKNANDDKYTVKVLVTPNEIWEEIIDEKIEIHTNVEVEIVNGHCKFGSMIVKR